MNVEEMSFTDLRALAKDLGINAFQMGKADLKRAIEDHMGIKRGRPRWKPANLLDVDRKSDGWRYRWVENTPENIAKKRRERWDFVPKEDTAEHDTPDHVGDGSPLTSVTEIRDMVLMRIPEEDAKERDAYYAELTRKQTVGLKDAVQEEMTRAASESGARGATVHGKIIIE